MSPVTNRANLPNWNLRMQGYTFLVPDKWEAVTLEQLVKDLDKPENARLLTDFDKREVIPPLWAIQVLVSPLACV